MGTVKVQQEYSSTQVQSQLQIQSQLHAPLQASPEVREKVRDQVDPGRLRRFTRQVLRDLETLENLLRDGRIEEGVHRIGAEQELFLVDENGLPAGVSEALLERLADDHYTFELGRFNLEINLDPLRLEGNCFRQLERELQRRIAAVREIGDEVNISVLLTGILPTLDLGHLTMENMSKKARYFALNEAMKRLRGEDYAIQIRGIDEVMVEHANVMLEACNTSFQVHYQVGADDFARYYNTAQAIAGPVLAAAVNSPLLFGRRLWAETRIPLFQQSVDTRSSVPPARRQIPRVSFGTDWVKESVLEIYRDDVARFPALFAQGKDLQEEEEVAGPPPLHALCKHNGTVYRWNRPCYGVLGGEPHLRIENRYLPSGPTIVDEVANSAFWCGLMRGLADEFPQIDRQMPFEQARKNFVQSAREGLDAPLDWLGQSQVPAHELIRTTFLPLARAGLRDLSVDEDQIDHYLGLLEERVETRQTGAQWMLDALGDFNRAELRPTDLIALTKAMEEREESGEPVARWTLPERPPEVRAQRPRLVRDLMTPNPFTVHPEQAVDLAVCLMDWRQVRHVPVEDAMHQLVGLVTYRPLLRTLSEGSGGPVSIADVMVREVVTISPEKTLGEALRLLEEHNVGCLPVVQNGKLVGILSERDFLPVAREVLDAT